MKFTQNQYLMINLMRVKFIIFNADIIFYNISMNKMNYFNSKSIYIYLNMFFFIYILIILDFKDFKITFSIQ